MDDPSTNDSVSSAVIVFGNAAVLAVTTLPGIHVNWLHGDYIDKKSSSTKLHLSWGSK